MSLISFSRLLVIVAFLCTCLVPLTGAFADGWKDYYNRGNAHFDKKQYDLAIAAYTTAMALNPRDESIVSNRGNTYLSKGDLDHAIADFNQAIALNPQDPYPYFNRGLAFKKKGLYDRAIVDYNQAIALNPRKALYFNNRGSTYLSKGDLDRAIADFNQALKVDPSYTLAKKNLAFAYRKKGTSAPTATPPIRRAAPVPTYPAPQIRRAAPAPPPPVNLAFPLQSELKRIGCLTGRVDGVWGSGSRSALRRFSDQAGLRLGSEPSQQAIDETRRTEAGYCQPLRAAPRRAAPKPKKKRNKYSCGKNGQYNEEIPGCECFNGYNWNGSRCVQRKTVKQLPRCANAVNAICEGVAHKQCQQHSDSDRKFGACFDRAEASCARSNGCR